MTEVILPGTGGMIPLSERWLSTCHISHNGMNFLIDCGEGTQIALEEAGIKAGRIDVILITHFHADHIMGIPGLLLSMANKGKKSPLLIIGPKQVAEVVSSLCVVTPKLPYEVRLMETEDGAKTEIGEIEIESMMLSHRMPCYGYRFTIKRKPVFSPEKAKALDIPVKFYNTLHNGEEVKLDNGRIVKPEEVIESYRTPKIITYCTDTLPIPKIADFAKDSDLFICEGMYADDEMAEKMTEKHHMLFSDAVKLAAKANVKKLLLTHFSPAMKNAFEYEGYLKEMFENGIVGYDGIKIEKI